MAIAFITATDLGNNNASGQTLTSSFTASAANSVLVIGLAVGHVSDGDEAISVTYGGMTMTRGVYGSDNATARNTYIYFLNGPPPGANNFIITATGPADIWIAGGAAQYAGAAWLAAADATKSAGTAVPAMSLTTSILPVADRTWAIAFSDAGDAWPLSAGAGLTLRAIDGIMSGTWGLFDSAGPISPAANYSMTVNFSSSAAKAEMCAITLVPSTGITTTHVSLNVNI